MQSMGGCCCSDRHAGRVVRWCRSCPITAWRVQRWGRIRPINNAGGRKKRKREGKKKASRGRRRERKNKASLHFLPSILCRNRLFRVIIIHRLLSHLLALSFAFSFPTPFSSSSRISFFQSSRPPPPPPTPTGRISQLSTPAISFVNLMAPASKRVSHIEGMVCLFSCKLQHLRPAAGLNPFLFLIFFFHFLFHPLISQSIKSPTSWKSAICTDLSHRKQTEKQQIRSQFRRTASLSPRAFLLRPLAALAARQNRLAAARQRWHSLPSTSPEPASPCVSGEKKTGRTETTEATGTEPWTTWNPGAPAS